MKLDIYFRDKKMGTITVHGNGVIYNEGEDRIKKIIVYYQKSSREGDLAQRIQRGLHDNWHTQIVSDPDAAPLEESLHQSMALALPEEATFGMVGDEWHGPTAPGPGWVQVGQGERGGKVWKQQQGAQPQPTPGAEPAPAPQQPGQIDPQLQQMLQSLDPDQVQEVMQFVTKMQARGQRKPGAAKVPEAKSAEAEQVFTQIRGLFDEIDQGTINNDKIIKALNSLQGLSLPQIHHVLDDLQIAEKPPSKKKAVAIVEMVISHQVEARERSHFQNPVLDQQAGGQ